MHPRPAVFAAALAALGTAPSALAFEGRVVLPEGGPVAEARVSVIGRTGSTTTDRKGRFSWQPDPPVPFEILVVLSDGRYAAPVLVEEIPDGRPVTVTITPVVMESVTVAAGATPHIEAPPASGMTLIGREDLEQRRPSRLADTLENIPGVGRLGEGHSVVPSIRGLARGRTLILIDGARVTAERRAGPRATYLDPFALEGVEVSRGPGSVAYGSDAFGGVIDARTRRPEPGAPLAVRMQASAGAGQPEYGAGVEISRGFAQGGMLVQARLREFGDYRSPRGDVPLSESSDRGLLLRAGRRAGPGSVSFGWQSDFGRNVGKPAIDSRDRRTFYPREDSHRVTLDYDLDPRGGLTSLGVSGFVGSYRLVLDRDTRARGGDPRTLTRSDVEARDYGLRVSAGRLAGPGRIEMGVDANGRFGLRARGLTRTFDGTGRTLSERRERAIEDARRTDLAAYLSADMPAGAAVTVGAGLRADRVTTRNRGGTFGSRSTSDDALSGFGSVTAELGRGVNVTAQVSRGFRDPTLSDRYFAGVSGRGLVTGNPDLDPEESLQYDLALRHSLRRVRWAVYAYRYGITDLIERFERGEDLFFFRNRGRARLKGVEVELQARTRGGVVIEIGAQHAEGKAPDDDSDLDDVPARSLTAQLRRPLGEKVDLSLRGAFHARDHRPGPTEKTTPGYAVFDAGASWRMTPDAELRLLLRNLFDRAHPSSPDEKAVLAPGRALQATLVVEF